MKKLYFCKSCRGISGHKIISMTRLSIKHTPRTMDTPKVCPLCHDITAYEITNQQLQEVVSNPTSPEETELFDLVKSLGF